MGLGHVVLVEDVPELLREVIRFVWRPVVVLLVVAVAEEDGVLYAVVHVEEDGGQEVAEDPDDDGVHQHVVDPLSEMRGAQEPVGEGHGPAGDAQLAEDEHPFGQEVGGGHLRQTLQQQVHRAAAGGAEALALDDAHDVRVAVEVVDEAVQALEGALNAPAQPLHRIVLGGLGLGLKPRGQELYELHDGQDERPERDRPQVIPQGLPGPPEHTAAGDGLVLRVAEVVRLRDEGDGHECGPVQEGHRPQRANQIVDSKGEAGPILIEH
mmetsp:Transcript_77979/g.130961  ORF Transcript_77979/g.130961 Transcript_77979/m.130961 type:complete len:267 (+) Transcript_77979:428-1228(+)